MTSEDICVNPKTQEICSGLSNGRCIEITADEYECICLDNFAGDYCEAFKGNGVFHRIVSSVLVVVSFFMLLAMVVLYCQKKKSKDPS